jgi:hypothetical protein
MLRKLFVILVLIGISTVAANIVYRFSFGVWFDVNGTYFPVTGNCYPLFASAIRRMTWLASSSTISLVYVLYRNRKVNT